MQDTGSKMDQTIDSKCACGKCGDMAFVQLRRFGPKHYWRHDIYECYEKQDDVIVRRIRRPGDRKFQAEKKPKRIP